MLKDTARIQAYKNAIFSCVEYFKDKVVMDVGAGTGRFRLCIIMLCSLVDSCHLV